MQWRIDHIEEGTLFQRSLTRLMAFIWTSYADAGGGWRTKVHPAHPTPTHSTVVGFTGLSNPRCNSDDEDPAKLQEHLQALTRRAASMLTSLIVSMRQ